jgi:hypothetical protein
LEVLPGLPNGYADLVFGSPPYEDARLYDIDFKLRGQAWVDWMVPIVKESLRVCNGLVAFVVEGRTRKYQWSATPALLLADLHRAGVCLRKPPAFHRVGIPGSGGPDWLRNDYEFIVCATNGGKLPWSENTAMGHPPKWAPGGAMSHRLSDGSRVNQWGASTGRKLAERGQDGKRKDASRPSHQTLKKRRLERGNEKGSGYRLPAKANPGNVIRCNVGGAAMGSSIAHESEAPFPEYLAEFFIRSFCRPGGIVLDPFSGSGTTAAVAEKLERRWVAIDIRETQCELTRRRIAEAKQQPKELFA